MFLVEFIVFELILTALMMIINYTGEFITMYFNKK